MTSSSPTVDPLESRVLVLAVTRRDAAVTRELLTSAWLDPFVCDSLDHLAREIPRGAAAVLLTDEAAERDDPAAFLEVLHNQPEWSELPVIMLVRSNEPGEVAKLLSTLKGATLLERPVFMRTLVSTVQAAVRARLRQYQVRRQIAEIRAGGEALRRQNQQLAASEQWLRVALQAGQFGAFQLDLQTGRMETSATARAIFGVPDGHPFDYPDLQSLIHADDLRRKLAAVDAAVSGDGRYHAEFRIRTPAGEHRWIMTRGQVIREPGEFPRMVGVALDVTEQKLAEAERERLLAAERDARADAEQANRAKDHFLAVLSHELRTPLTPVLATAQMMRSEPGIPDDVRDAFEMIRRNVELEARLIDDLLDLTRIVRGKLELQPVPVDVHGKLASVLAIVDSDIRAKRLSLVTDLAARPHHVRADPARLQQVLWNLLKNALKFTPEGGTITVRTWNDADRLHLSVSDTGVGIAPDLLPRLFNAFEQGGRQTTRQFGGLGLGLAITKALVDAHGGSIAAVSDGANCGATFVIQLPVLRAAVPKETDGAGDARPNPRPPLNCKILIVEDHPDTARAMARMLALRGYTVRTADSVASAISAVASDTYDLLISDIGLPDGSGLDLMRQITATAPMRAIALSGFGMEEDVRRSKAAGFHAHMTKPVNIDRLEAAVRQLVAIAPCAGTRPGGANDVTSSSPDDTARSRKPGRTARPSP